MSRRKRGQESNGQTDVQEVNPPADLSADRENGRQDDLRKWLKGESNLLLWLDEEPTTLSSLFYSGETAAEEALLREKVAGCEEEIARLRDELSSRPAVDPAVMERYLASKFGDGLAAARAAMQEPECASQLWASAHSG